MKEVKPKRLWYASTKFRQSGKWFPSETFYLNKPYFPEVIVPTKCHVLYETPQEAFMAVYPEVCEVLRKSNPHRLQVFIYSVKPTLLNRGSYHSPESYADKEIFTRDRCLFKRHLIRQSCLFTRELNVEMSFNKFDSTPITDVFFVDEQDKEQFLMPMRPPNVTLTYASFSGYQAQAITESLFNIEATKFNRPLVFKPHERKNLEKKNAIERNLASA